MDSMFIPRPAFPGRTFTPVMADVSVTGKGHPIILAILEQLPEGVARRVAVEISTDPYYLATKATFTTEDGRAFDVRLGDMVLPNGQYGAAQVPIEFITHLCVAL